MEYIRFVLSFLTIMYIDYMKDWIASCLAMTKARHFELKIDVVKCTLSYSFFSFFKRKP